MTPRPDHWQAMVASCRRLFPCQADAEDAAAAVVMGLYIDGALSDASLALLRTAVRRQGIDDVRSAVARRVRERSYSSLLGDVPDLAERAEERDEAAWLVREARLHLTPNALRLMDLLGEGHTVVEAGRLLGLTPAASYSQVARMRQVLERLQASSRRHLAVGVASLGGFRKLVVLGSAAGVSTTALSGLLLLPGGALEIDVDTEVPAAQQAVVGPYAQSGTEQPAKVLERDATSPSAPRSLPTALVARDPDRSKGARREVASVRPVGQAGVTLSEGDTGGDENSPVDVVLACLEDLQVSPSKIGCSGESGSG